MSSGSEGIVASASSWPPEHLELLRRILQNVQGTPADSKFRRLKLTNPKVAALLQAPGAREGLVALGWRINDDDEVLELPGCAALQPLADVVRRLEGGTAAATEGTAASSGGPAWSVTVLRGPLRTRLELPSAATLGTLALEIERSAALGRVPRCRQSLLSGYPPRPVQNLTRAQSGGAEQSLAELGLRTVMLVDIWEELVSDLRRGKASFSRLAEMLAHPSLRGLVLNDNRDFVLQQSRLLLRQRVASITESEVSAARQCMQALWPLASPGECRRFCSECAGAWLSSDGVQDQEPEDAAELRFVLQVDRLQLFASAVARVQAASPQELCLPLEVRFLNEAAEDAGGLRREFFNEFGRALASAPLWQLSPAGSLVPVPIHVAQHIAPNSQARDSAYRSCGRIFGMALCQAERAPKQPLLLGLPLSRSFLRVVQGNAPADLEELQKELNAEQRPEAPDFRGNPAFRQLSLQELGLEGQLAFCSAGAMPQEGASGLAPGDPSVPVTEETKEEWLFAALRYELVQAVEDSAAAFRLGVCELVGTSHLALLSAVGLRELWAGHGVVTDEDLKAWKARTDVSPVVAQQADWLFHLLEEEKLARSRVLKFATGSDRWPVSLQGFSFAIEPMDGGDETLPCAMTCGNMLQLPRYSRQECLRDRLLQAMDWGLDLHLS